MRRYSLEYVDRLLDGRDYGELADLSSHVCGSAQFELSAADYGLPLSAFVFVESLLWMAMAVRSGAQTYFEAAPHARQVRMLDALREHAPAEYATWYSRGMTDWRDELQMDLHDRWVAANEEGANQWLRGLANANRDVFVELTT
jgi:hypothetical protein